MQSLSNFYLIFLNSIKAGYHSGSLWRAEQWEQDQGWSIAHHILQAIYSKAEKQNLTSVLTETLSATWEGRDHFGFMDKHKLHFWYFVFFVIQRGEKKAYGMKLITRVQRIWKTKEKSGDPKKGENHRSEKKKNSRKGKREEEVKIIHFFLSASCKEMTHLKRKIKINLSEEMWNDRTRRETWTTWFVGSPSWKIQ